MDGAARIVVALALASATAITAACKKTDRAAKPAEARPTAAPPAELAAPDFTVTARELYAEYRPKTEAPAVDAVRAKYARKTVRISGEVEKNGDAMGTWELTLVANDHLGRAFLHPAAAGAADVKALTPGAKVTLQCVSDGWEVGPQLKYCVIVK